MNVGFFISKDPKARGQQIRELRLAAGLTQLDVVQRAHVSERTVGRIEAGYNVGPTYKNLEKILAALGGEVCLYYRPLPPPPVTEGAVSNERQERVFTEQLPEA